MPDEMQGPSAPKPGLVSPPPSSGSSLFIKICLALGGVAMLGTCAALLSPAGRQFTQSSVELMSSVGGATTAPGTDALRAIGCDTAMVMPFEQLLDPIAQLSDALGQAEDTDAEGLLDGTLLVQCMPNFMNGEDLTCEQIAITYGQAVQAEDEFVVILERANVQTCSGFFRADGTMTQSLGDDFETIPDEAF